MVNVTAQDEGNTSVVASETLTDKETDKVLARRQDKIGNDSDESVHSPRSWPQPTSSISVQELSDSESAVSTLSSAVSSFKGSHSRMQSSSASDNSQRSSVFHSTHSRISAPGLDTSAPLAGPSAVANVVSSSNLAFRSFQDPAKLRSLRDQEVRDSGSHESATSCRDSPAPVDFSSSGNLYDSSTAIIADRRDEVTKRCSSVDKSKTISAEGLNDSHQDLLEREIDNEDLRATRIRVKDVVSPSLPRFGRKGGDEARGSKSVFECESHGTKRGEEAGKMRGKGKIAETLSRTKALHRKGRKSFGTFNDFRAAQTLAAEEDKIESQCHSEMRPSHLKTPPSSSSIEIEEAAATSPRSASREAIISTATTSMHSRASPPPLLCRETDGESSQDQTPPSHVIDTISETLSGCVNEGFHEIAKRPAATIPLTSIDGNITRTTAVKKYTREANILHPPRFDAKLSSAPTNLDQRAVSAGIERKSQSWSPSNIMLSSTKGTAPILQLPVESRAVEPRPVDPWAKQNTRSERMPSDISTAKLSSSYDDVSIEPRTIQKPSQNMMTTTIDAPSVGRSGGRSFTRILKSLRRVRAKGCSQIPKASAHSTIRNSAQKGLARQSMPKDVVARLSFCVEQRRSRIEDDTSALTLLDRGSQLRVRRASSFAGLKQESPSSRPHQDVGKSSSVTGCAITSQSLKLESRKIQNITTFASEHDDSNSAGNICTIKPHIPVRPESSSSVTCKRAWIDLILRRGRGRPVQTTFALDCDRSPIISPNHAKSSLSSASTKPWKWCTSRYGTKLARQQRRSVPSSSPYPQHVSQYPFNLPTDLRRDDEDVKTITFHSPANELPRMMLKANSKLLTQAHTLNPITTNGASAPNNFATPCSLLSSSRQTAYDIRNDCDASRSNLGMQRKGRYISNCTNSGTSDLISHPTCAAPPVEEDRSSSMTADFSRLSQLDPKSNVVVSEPTSGHPQMSPASAELKAFAKMLDAAAKADAARIENIVRRIRLHTPPSEIRS